MSRIQKAIRKGTPALISLWGLSGSGKTYSALQLARGLVGPSGKIGMIDTENRRGEFYADLVGGWDHLDLQPPFTPQRYIEAFAEFERAGGYGCIIVDSMSHVWEGEGGVLDMADSGRAQSGAALQGLKKWQAPKMAYKRMMNDLIRAPFHVIFCLRAKNKVEQKGGGEIVDKGLTPICEKNFIFEMTVDAQLIKESHVPGELKCPEALLDAFPRNKVITPKTGEIIAAWVGSGAAVDTAGDQLKRKAREIATKGSTHLRDMWENELTKDQKKALQSSLEELKGLAAEADREEADRTRSEGQNDNPLDDGFTGNGEAAA
jgi:hypothetical protein